MNHTRILLFLIPHLLLAQPRIDVVGGTKHNLGTFDEGEQVVRVFTIKNVGKDTLFIEDVSTSCGCAVAEQSASYVAPGGLVQLKVKIDTNELSGRVKKEIFVDSNDPSRKELTIELHAVIMPMIQVEPRYVNFRDLKRGTTVNKVIVMTNRTNVPIVFKSVSVADSQITAEIVDKVLYPNKETHLLLTCTPLNIGKLIGRVRLITNHPKKPTVNISYVGNIIE